MNIIKNKENFTNNSIIILAFTSIIISCYFYQIFSTSDVWGSNNKLNYGDKGIRISRACIIFTIFLSSFLLGFSFFKKYLKNYFFEFLLIFSCIAFIFHVLSETSTKINGSAWDPNDVPNHKSWPFYYGFIVNVCISIVIGMLSFKLVTNTKYPLIKKYLILLTAAFLIFTTSYNYYELTNVGSDQIQKEPNNENKSLMITLIIFFYFNIFGGILSIL